MKKIALLFAFLFALGASAAAAQTRVSVAVGFAVPRPYVSGYVVVGPPAPLYLYRPVYRRPALIVVEREPRYAERLFFERHGRRFHSYRPAHACWSYRCGY